MANDRRNEAVHVTSQLNYSTITLPSEKIHSEKIFFIYLFILAKVAAKWQLLTILFRKSKGDNKSQICHFSRYFSRKGKKFSHKCDCCIGRNFEPCIWVVHQDSAWTEDQCFQLALTQCPINSALQVKINSWIYSYLKIMCLEQFSNECRKTKTNVP